jgi:hypothetical protein
MTNKLPLWGRVGVMDSNVDKVVKAWDTARNKVDKVRLVDVVMAGHGLGHADGPLLILVGTEERWSKVDRSSVRIEQPHFGSRDPDSNAVHGVSTARSSSS